MRAWLLLLGSLLGATSFADVVSDAVEATELTIYRDTKRGTEPMSLGDDDSTGIAMVTETRTIEIPAGASTIQFRGVADGIVPQTATLDDIPATIVEANFDYNLLAPGSLIAKSLGRPVTLIRTNPSSGGVEERQGILRSGPQGVVVDFGGEVEALNCSGLPERLVFSDVPESLRDKPTLSLSIRAATAGKYQVRLSYLVLGMDWSADYTARIHPDGRRIDISAWITLLNRNGSRFADATTHVVAGTLARQEDATQAPEIDVPWHSDSCWPIGDFRRRQVLADRVAAYAPAPEMALARNVDEIVVTGHRRAAQLSELGDYKLYTLPFTTTVEPRQMKQAGLLVRDNVQFQRLYQHRITEENLHGSDPVRARSLLRIANTKRAGLGLPLPAGTWRVFETMDDGKQYFLGERPLEDTPIDLSRDIEFGSANDVTVVTRATEEDDDGVMEVEISNAGVSVAAVEIVLSPGMARDVKIVKESHRHREKDGGYVWTVRAAPNKPTILRYTMSRTDDE